MLWAGLRLGFAADGAGVLVRAGFRNQSGGTFPQNRSSGVLAAVSLPLAGGSACAACWTRVAEGTAAGGRFFGGWSFLGHVKSK